jgi:hypothetical protein
MKKLLTYLSIGLLFVSPTAMNAFTFKTPFASRNVWGVNLTDKEETFRYTRGQIIKSTYSFKVPPMSVSDAISNKGHSTSAMGDNVKNEDLTLIAYHTGGKPAGTDPNMNYRPNEINERTSPQKSKKLEEIVAKNFGGKKPADVLKNWGTFKR